MLGIVSIPRAAHSDEFVVYNVFRPLDLGNPGETPPKDYYVNMGSAQGLRKGATLDVFRKKATYDLLSQRLYKEVIFPIATLRIIHVENGAAIARLEKMLPADETPGISPPAVMIGDVVRLSN